MNICNTPFNMLQICYDCWATCCPDWFTTKDECVVTKQDNITDPWEAWNHYKIVQLRQRWLDENMSLCNNCPRKLIDIVSSSLKHKLHMTVGPEHIVFANDYTTNLNEWGGDQNFIYDQSRRVLEAFTSDLQVVWIVVTGDCFVSPAYRQILQELNNPSYSLNLFTDGLLLPKYWDSISGIHNNIFQLHISIDASTKETYEKIRPGQKWEQVLNTLKFIRDIRKCGVLPRLQLNMVVTVENYHEIPSFVQQGLDNMATEINFSRGEMHKYSHLDVCDSYHPEHHRLLEILEHPLLKEKCVTQPTIDT